MRQGIGQPTGSWSIPKGEEALAADAEPRLLDITGRCFAVDESQLTSTTFHKPPQPSTTLFSPTTTAQEDKR